MPSPGPAPRARAVLRSLAGPLFAACWALGTFAPAAHAQSGTWPNRPVRLVVPVAAGGNVDIVARAVAGGLADRLGQPVLVENRPSASSLVGTQAVARAPADGYTLLAIANTFVSAPAIVAQPGYDPVKDFTGVTLTCRIPMVLVVNPAVPARSVAELIALAKTRPDGVTYASSGNGSTGHIAAELFMRQAGVRMLHVPYKGNAQSVADLVGGQVQVMFDQVSTSVAHVRAGKLRALAVTTRSRAVVLPDVAPLAESGLPDYEDATFNGILAPAGTPAEIVNRLHTEITAVLASPDLRKRMSDQGIEIGASTSPDAFGAFLAREVAKYARLARDAGIRAE
jgi:tripartite-type tricarboxylate transporter receptor subunit TctC